MLLLLCVAFGLIAAGTARAAPNNAGVLHAVNAARVSHGLVALRLSRPLSAAACNGADAMIAGGYFDHRGFDRRIDRFYPRYREAGENLVYVAPDLGAAEAVRLWMASPGHRENLLGHYRELGVCVRHFEGSVGIYAGVGPITLISTEYGRQ
jgi:uncharacterized protein YkwD